MGDPSNPMGGSFTLGCDPHSGMLGGTGIPLGITDDKLWPGGVAGVGQIDPATPGGVRAQCILTPRTTLNDTAMDRVLVNISVTAGTIL
jgi:hypothetical protein